MKHFLILGSHPLLSLAEAKAVIGGRKPELAESMAIFDVDSLDGSWMQERLSGTVKLGDVIAECPMRELTGQVLADVIDARPRGKEKVLFGLTMYGASAAAKNKMKKLPIELKRELQTRGRSVRWVTGEKGSLSPAAVAKLSLVSDGYDIVIGIFGETALIGLTTNVQDADAWSLRDYGRPFRDTATGMLPPKLARLMVNMAIGAKKDATILDPFCGGGTVLMEASLLGFRALVGSDIDQKQVDGCKENLEWMAGKELITRAELKNITMTTEPVESIGDKLVGHHFDAIVTEGYLGRPLTGQETLETLRRQKIEIEEIWRDAFRSFAMLQKKGDRIVCTWPVFVSSHGTVAVDLKDDVERLGYRVIDPLSGWQEKTATLTYARPDQRVKRNVVVLEKR